MTKTMQIIFCNLMTSFLFLNVTTANINSIDRSDIDGQKKILPKNLSIYSTLATSGSVSSDDTVEGSRALSLRLIPNYELSGGHSVGADFSLVQRFDVVDFYLSNLDINWKLPTQKIWADISADIYIVGTIPTNQDSFEEGAYRSSLAANALLVKQLWPIRFPTVVIYSLTAGKNFHKFNSNNLRTPNVEYYIEHALILRKTFNKFRVGLTGVYTPRWDYQATYKPQFILAQSVSYLDKGFKYTLSHSNKGNALDYSGRLSNVEFFEDYTSKVSLSVSYNLN